MTSVMSTLSVLLPRSSRACADLLDQLQQLRRQRIEHIRVFGAFLQGFLTDFKQFLPALLRDLIIQLRCFFGFAFLRKCFSC